jgi:Flp pilus assembly protein TadB
VLPFFGAGIMAVIQPGFAGPLLHDPRGQHLIFIGGVAMILGWFTMKHMITTATSE